MSDARELAVGILGAKKLRELEAAGLAVEFVFKANEDGQLTWTDLEPAMEYVQRTEEELRDYYFMQREIERLKSYLQDAGEGTVGSYEENAGIRAIGKNSDKTFNEVARRERKWKRLKKLESIVERIDRAAEKITDEKEVAVLEALMDGERNNVIARHLGVSRERYYEIKRNVIKKMAWLMFYEK